jgi:acyl carrier protein
MHDVSNPHQIEERIKAFIAENLLYAENGFNYPEDASFLQEGIIDSLGVMQLVEFVGSDFQITVDQREVTPENFDSVGKLALFVRRKLQPQS